MPHPAAPVKTPLGHDELRHRTQGLGQRYRTVLLLVDGQRSLAEVLSTAHQAGAQTSHLERLVQLGMVELPSETPSGTAEQPGPPGAEPLDPAAAMPAGESPAELAPATAPAQVAPDLPGPEVVAAPPNPASEVAAEQALVPEPAPQRDDEQTLAEVRRLLLDTLRRDTLLARALAPSRVRSARTQDDLIGLVWEIERERAHARRKRGQLLNLQRARELLGMGNTLVAGDSLQAPPSVL